MFDQGCQSDSGNIEARNCCAVVVKLNREGGQAGQYIDTLTQV